MPIIQTMSDERETITKTAEAMVAGQSLESVIRAVREFESRVVNEAFQSGFKTGWEQAFKAMFEIASRQGVESIPGFPGIPEVKLKTQSMPFSTEMAPSPHIGELDSAESTHDAVYRVIRTRPGLRGVQIIEFLRAEKRDVQERTVRTALYRLKKDEKAKVVDGRWYSPENVPPNPLSLLKKEDDDAAAS